MQDRPAGGPSRPPPLDAPVAGLADDAEALAKAWLLELVDARPLDAARELALEELAADGPALCAAVVRALVSDGELDRLHGDGDLTALPGAAGRLAGASGAAAVVEAVEALRRSLWGAIARTAAEPPTAGLADRLAHVCSVVTVQALGERRGAVAESAPPEDELARIRVARGGGRKDVPLWREALDRQLAEGGRTGRRFALLLAELDDAERLRSADEAGVADAIDRIGHAVRPAVRRGDLIAHEDDGRIWLIASDAGRAPATVLADRLAGTVERTASLNGEALTASIGIAIYPDDGRDAEALTAQAEEGVYAARAAGTRVGGGV